MTRNITIAAAQLGPVQKADSREQVVERLLDLLHAADRRGAELVVFPELALTTFFPRWHLTDQAEIDSYFETEMPNKVVKPLFDEAKRRGIGFQLGYAELTPDGHHYNMAILVERDGTVVQKYRKVHVPGHDQPEEWRPFQHLERYYFEPGNKFEAVNAFGGIIGQAICNDRRWSETYRVYGLQGTELLLIGYNTPFNYAPDHGQDHLAGFHNNLVMAAGAYMNGMYVVGVAKGGVEEGVWSLAESQIIAPSGEVIARTITEGDEIAVANCDLDYCYNYKKTVFDFNVYRIPEAYTLISQMHESAETTDDQGFGGEVNHSIIPPVPEVAEHIKAAEASEAARLKQDEQRITGAGAKPEAKVGAEVGVKTPARSSVDTSDQADQPAGSSPAEK